MAFFLSATLIPPCANSFRFGLSYPVSKLLKFFKLLGQCPNAKTKRMQFASLDAVTHTPTPIQSRGGNAITVAEPAVIVESKTQFR